MAFNITQIINKVLKIENTQRENPFGTLKGHDISSISESFWARLAREGRPKSIPTNSIVFPNDSTYKQLTLNPSSDCLFYPRYASITATVDAELMVQINTNIPQLGSQYAARGFVKAGTPLIITFDGDSVISPIGTISAGGINSGSSAGTLIGTIFGYEVNLNA